MVAGGAGFIQLQARLRDGNAAEQGELWRYAWGLLDVDHDEEDEAAIWLRAWALAHGDEARLDPEPFS
jgi:hypothetical protein